MEMNLKFLHMHSINMFKQPFKNKQNRMYTIIIEDIESYTEATGIYNCISSTTTLCLSIKKH